MERLREAYEIHQLGYARQGEAQRRGHRGALQSPAEGEDEEPVQKDIERGGHDGARHGEARTAVQAYEEAAHHVEHHQGLAEGYPPQVTAGQGNERLVASEEAARGREVEKDECRTDEGHQCASHEGLRHVDVGRLAFSAREVNAGHHAASHAEHKGEAGHEVEDGRGDIDSRQCVAAAAVAHEGAVRDVEYHDGEHADESRHEHLAEEPPYGLVGKVYGVAFIHDSGPASSLSNAREELWGEAKIGKKAHIRCLPLLKPAVAPSFAVPAPVFCLAGLSNAGGLPFGRSLRKGRWPKMAMRRAAHRYSFTLTRRT